MIDIQEILERQLDYNYAIACAGLNDNYGANIGKVLLKSFGNDVKNKAKAYAAAGSDARMNGCELPVVINSGSGNQGMTCSLPVIIYAQELKVSKEKMFRALALSNLVAIHEKSGIGTLEIQLKSIVMKREHRLVKVHVLHIYRFKAILRWRKKVAIWMH